MGGDGTPDIGLLGLTTKHIHFAGSRKRFRVRYDRIVAFEPFSDGFGIMRDAQTARPQTFQTGDGWFAYNLAANLARSRAEQPAPPNIPPLPHRETSLHHREGLIHHPRPENPGPSLPLGPVEQSCRNGRRSEPCRQTAPTATISTRGPQRY